MITKQTNAIIDSQIEFLRSNAEEIAAAEALVKKAEKAAAVLKNFAIDNTRVGNTTLIVDSKGKVLAEVKVGKNSAVKWDTNASAIYAGWKNEESRVRLEQLFTLGFTCNEGYSEKVRLAVEAELLNMQVSGLMGQKRAVEPEEIFRIKPGSSEFSARVSVI